MIFSRFKRPSLSVVLIAFLVLYAVAMLSGIGRFAFVGPDEPRYAQVAREMFVSGDYVSTRLCGLLWFEKPILFYWLAATSYSFFGVHEFAARLPSALLCLLSVALVFITLRRAGFARWGVISAVVLATSAMWMSFGYAATIDMTLASTLCAAFLAGFLASTTEGRTRLLFLGLCAAATACSMLAKGLVGVFFVIAILGIYNFVSRRAILRSWKDALLAVAVFLFVAGLWYVPVTLRHGSVFIDEFFINQHFKRFLTDKYKHSQAAYFYIFIVMVGAMPWTLFLWPAVQKLRALQPRQNHRDALLSLAWIWLLIPVAFFSISTSKLPSYILPIFPALAIILGAEIESLWSSTKVEQTAKLRRIAVANALIWCVLGGIGLVLRDKEPYFSGVTTSFFVALCVGGVATLVAIRGGHLKRAIFAPAAAILGVMVTAFFILPAMSKDYSLSEYSLSVVSQMKPGENMAFYKFKKQYVHVFYGEGRVIYYGNGVPLKNISTGDDIGLETREALLKALRYEMREGDTSLVVLTLELLQKELENDPAFTAQKIAQHEDTIAMRLTLKTPVN